MRFLGPDQYLLDAARGWLDLDDCESAEAELKEISSANSEHPEVMKVRWELLGRAGRWQEAYELAEALRTGEIEEPFGWHATALSLHKLGRSNDAFDLIGAFCPKNLSAELAYTTARVACVLGKLPEAKLALEFAYTLSTDEESLKQRAERETDLERLWSGERDAG
jgi:predicted Zn-dependent protease